MKKLFYLLFAFAIIVACEKDAFDQDVQEINVLEEAEEINAFIDNAFLDIDYSAFIEGLAGDITKEEIAEYEANKTTARTGAAGENWIHVVFFPFGTNNIPLAYQRSEDTAEICESAGQVSILYILETATSGATRLRVEEINAAGVAQPATYTRIGSSLRANYNTLFSQTIDRLSRATTSNGFALGRVPSVATLASRGIDFSCSTATVYEYGTQIIGGAHDGRVIVPIDPTNMDSASNPTAAAVGTENIQLQLVRRVAGFGVLTWEAVGDPFTNPNYVTPPAARWTMTMVEGVMTFDRPDMGTYTLTPAPFPLTGLLGTVTREADGVTGTLNYAGTGNINDATTHAGVRNAIETSFAN